MSQSHQNRLSIGQVIGFLVLIGLLLVLYTGLWRDASHIPSAQIGKAAQKFTLLKLQDDNLIALDDFKGQWVVLNFWASWCGACKTEHHVLMKAGKQFSINPKVSLIGINYKDSKSNALKFLNRLGTFPYPSGQDPLGRTGIDFGVYGLPETFFINPQGIIVSRHVGAITPEIIEQQLAPVLKGKS